MTDRARSSWSIFAGLLVCTILSARPLGAAEGQNLIADGSFEEPMPKNQFGHVFKQWSGWKYEGDCEFRVGKIAHSGKTSLLIFGASQPKIRASQTIKGLAPGRYKMTAYVRGLDIGEGVWKASTEVMVDNKYMPLKKNGTFGWTPITYVFEIAQKKDVPVSFGTWAPGYFWVDDVSVVAVDNNVALTPAPVFGKEEKPIEPPGALGNDSVRCSDCGYKNQPAWGTCYACGGELGRGQKVASGPAVRMMTSFEEKNPFAGGKIVAEHATDGTKALKIEKSYVSWAGPQDWSGYDYLKADVFADSDQPLKVFVEIHDTLTTGYWTRVNYETLVPPGKSALILPLAQLYVGEKSRPGRNLVLGGIKNFVLSLGDKPAGPLFVDNMRLERDVETPKMLFEGLYAFDFGTSTSPLMPGFTRIDPSTLYSKGRGYGLKDARIFRAVDALQPDPLYQDCLCIEKGGLAVDVPNGRYHVFVNIDNPSGFWGEYQVYRKRAILANGKPVVEESMTFDSLKKKYFRFWDTEDLPTENTFDKYQRAYYQEKEFDVDVIDGQLNIDFVGENFGCSVSAVILYSTDKAEQGKKFLQSVVEKRRFFFDNYFHRVEHKPTGEALAPTPADTQRGYVAFTRDCMEDVYYNDTPKKDEIAQPVTGFAFAGQYEPLTVAICPLADLGKVTATISDLGGPGMIPAKDISVGYVSYRISRVSMDGAVYTISPRLVIPRNAVTAPRGIARRFWLTVRVPQDAKPGIYKGQITLAAEKGQTSTVPVEFRVYPGTLDPVDLPVGPWGHQIHIPWDGNDPQAKAWNQDMAEKSLHKLREYGFTTFTGLPSIRYLGFKQGKPQFDFTIGDRQMELARKCGFTMPIVSYTGMAGLNLYFKDEVAMKAAGFNDYTQFIKAVFTAIQEHADAANWLPVYWNLGDEPIGDDLRRAAENAEAYRAAFPKGPPLFTAATSFSSGKADDPHFRFGKALHAADVNGHNEESVRMLQQAGSGWGFYNGGNRWTYGVYLYKAAKEFDLKFRLSWHWNVVAGDPYYALDCREDDYAWCNANPDGELIPSVTFEREMRGGLDDYRCLLTLARLAKEKNDSAAQNLIAQRMSAFKLGQREHDKLFPVSDWREFRLKMATEIERLRGAK